MKHREKNVESTESGRERQGERHDRWEGTPSNKPQTPDHGSGNINP